MTPVRLETAAPPSRVKHSTTGPLQSLFQSCRDAFLSSCVERIECPAQNHNTVPSGESRTSDPLTPVLTLSTQARHSTNVCTVFQL